MTPVLSERIPQRDAARLLLAACLGDEPEGAYIELRFRHPGGPMRNEFHRVENFYGALDRVARRARGLSITRDVYFGVAPRRERSGGLDAIERVWALWTDCDTGEATAALKDFEPKPAVIVASGSGLHGYWPLSEPLKPQHAQRANRRLAHQLGADMRATDAARILRLPDTGNHKRKPPRPVRCVRLDVVAYQARDVVGRLPDPPDQRRPATGGRQRVRADVDVLQTIPASEYIPALLGVELGRDGKACCPFHQDRMPSLHAWEDPDRGWACFACPPARWQRPEADHLGGGIIDFGACLYGIEPRGAGFHRIRERLAADLLGAMGQTA